jgi:hypothetical protein
MPSSIMFDPGALKFYFPLVPAGASDYAYSVAAPVPSTAQVTASIQGSGKAQFSGLLLTAYRRSIAPPNPPGPFPAAQGAVGPVMPVQAQPIPSPFFVVPFRSPRKPAIRPGFGPNWVYVMTGQSDGTKPLLVEAQGMLEIDVTCTAPQQVGPSANHFVAEILVNGTTWNQTSIPLVLNVLAGDSCVLLAGENNSVELIAGEAAAGFTWGFQFMPGFSPPLDEDYPVTVVLNPGQGDVAPGVYLLPRFLTITFTNAAQGQTSIQANGTVGAYFFANAPSSGSFTIPQEAFVANSAEAGLCTSQKNLIGGTPIGYTILPSPIPPLPGRKPVAPAAKS